MFQLQMQTRLGWHTLVRFAGLDDAKPACDRLMMSEKSTSRVLEIAENANRIVYERRYNWRDDPDENWRDHTDFDNRDEFSFRWQEVGF